MSMESKGMRYKFIFISLFYPVLTCDIGEEDLQWYPENSYLLKGLGLFQDFTLHVFPDYPDPESDENFGLESFYLFGGDIVLDEEEPQDRSAQRKKDNLWPKGKIPYKIASDLKDQKNLIELAMENIESNTCIRFVPRKAEKNYIQILKGTGCSSKIGMSGGAQILSLAQGCYNLGKILHELVHALGFFHEQSRSDRDQYIDIYWENIHPGHEKNFVKMKPNQELLLTSYDYDSIMHYSEYSFSKDRKKGLRTMKAKKKGVILKSPSDKVLSLDDIKRISMLYKC